MKITFTIVIFLVSQYCIAQKENIKEKVSGNPYFKNVINVHGDQITYYISEFEREKKLPLIVYIQGSGYHSLFVKNGKNINPTSGHINLPYLSKGKAKILIIEKPGVKFLDDIQQDKRNPNFDKNFSLENWSERIVNTIDYVLSTENINGSKVMLLGHSEGGLVAAKVAKKMKNKVSNVCIFSGEGPSQLYSLYSFAESGLLFKEGKNNEEERIEHLLKYWKEIRKDSLSTDKFFLGFSYLRWHSFLKTSVIEELSSFKGHVLVIQGQLDVNMNPEASKILYTSLLSKGIDIKLEMIDDADHSFNIIKNESVTSGWEEVLNIALKWFQP